MSVTYISVQLVIVVFLCCMFWYQNIQDTQTVIPISYFVHLQLESSRRQKNYDSKFSVHQCVDVVPRLRSKYAIFIQLTGDGGVYFQSALKVAVRLNWYLKREVREETDIILHLVNATSKWTFNEAIDSAFRAGFDHVCQSRRIGSGSYSRFVIFNMIQYVSVLYIDADVIPLNDFSELLVNGTLALRQTTRHMMWAHEKNCDWFNSGVMLVVPEPDLYKKLMRAYESQYSNGRLSVLDHGPTAPMPSESLSSFTRTSGEILNLKPSCQKTSSRAAPNFFGDQALLNFIFHPAKKNMLEMDVKYNKLLYEDNRVDSEIVRDTSFVHFVLTKPWKWREPGCYTSYYHPTICNLWFETPTSLTATPANLS